MVKKQTVTTKNQLRFVIVTVFIFLIEVLASFIFIAQNDFLRHASEGLLLAMVASYVLPALLFVLAFAFMRKSSLLRRLTQAIVWTFGSMLVNTIATIVWYFPDTNNYDFLQLFYGPAIVTIVTHIVGLLIYRRSVNKSNRLLMPKWFEKSFILLGCVLVAASIFLFIRDALRYGLVPYPYILYLIIPLALLILLPVIGFISLRIMKSKVSRLYTAIFGVSFALYVGTGLSQFASTAQSGGSMQDFLMVGSYVVTVIVYLILLKRVYNRVRANEKL